MTILSTIREVTKKTGCWLHEWTNSAIKRAGEIAQRQLLHVPPCN
jgi:hypothetical protein